MMFHLKGVSLYSLCSTRYTGTGGLIIDSFQQSGNHVSRSCDQFGQRQEKKTIWEPALITAVALYTHTQRPFLNLNACASSNQN